MRNILLNILTHPRLERWRVLIPYPLFAGLITFTFAVPVSIPLMLTDPKHSASFLIIPFGAAISLVALCSLVALVGWLSGHRPFRMSWFIEDPNSVPLLVQKIRDAATAFGAHTMWERSKLGFVGVIGMEHEEQSFTHSASAAPIRISVLCRGDRAHFRVSGRTLVIWDTGERRRFEELGQDLLNRAAIDVIPGLTRV